MIGFSWFDLAWPWIGLIAAGVLAVLLFATPLLRADRALPRWHDPRWLGFLAVATYLVHQVEEYGIAADGVAHAFPDGLCAALGQPAYPACAIPPLFYLAVNVSLVWLAAPVAAVVSRRRPLIALTLWGVIAVNAVVHIVPAIATRAYDPGLATAVVLFVPLTVLVAVRAFGRNGPFRARGFVIIVAAGVLMHAVLGGGLALFLRGVIPGWAVVVAQPVAIAVGFAGVALLSPRVRRAAD